MGQLENAIEGLEQLKKEGYKTMCLMCRRVYRENPSEEYATGHGARLLEICKCSCDMFITIEEKIDSLKNYSCENNQIYC